LNQDVLEPAVLKQGIVSESHVLTVKFAVHPNASVIFHLEAEVAVPEFTFRKLAFAKYGKPNDQVLK